MKRLVLFVICTVFFSCKNTAPVTQTDSSETTQVEQKGLPPGWIGLFNKKEEAFLEADFKGVATSEGIEENLFPLQSTGVSTAPIMSAGKEFITSLTDDQRAKTTFAVDSDAWRRWTNVANGVYNRQGVSIKEMNQEQRKLAFNLMTASLSAKGLKLTKDIMKTDQTLSEMSGNPAHLDEELYYFTIMGSPSLTEPWGWQLDGHHLALNYFILGDQVVMTPTFMGGEPIITTTGKYAGNVFFQDEQNVGLKFMQSLDIAKQQKATIADSKKGNDIQAEAFGDNAIVNYEGLPVSELTDQQKDKLLDLAALYIGNMKKGHAAVKMEEVIKHINKTYFTWIGQTDENAVFYYRIHSPVILIEFDHQVPLMVQGGDKVPTRNHIHTMVRTPNGNDYGKDLLRQHLAEHQH